MTVFLLLLTATLDCFAACAALGASGIRIPRGSAFAVGLVSGCVYLISLFPALLVRTVVPDTVFRRLGFVVFFLMGIWSLFRETVREILRRRQSRSGGVQFGFSDIRCVFRIYLDETSADLDCSKILSFRESVLFAVSISADLIPVGLGTRQSILLAALSVLYTVLLSSFFAWSGNRVGIRLKKKIPVNLSWLTGTLFCVLAVGMLF